MVKDEGATMIGERGLTALSIDDPNHLIVSCFDPRQNPISFFGLKPGGMFRDTLFSTCDVGKKEICHSDIRSQMPQ